MDSEFDIAGSPPEHLDDPAKVYRLPPHSVEAEAGVLGCIFLSPQECIPICVERFKDRSDVFYLLTHRTIYETVVGMCDQGKAIDVITVQQVLRDRKQLEEVGGVAYLAALPDAVPSAANLGYYIDIVREKHALRLAIGACTEGVARAYEFIGEVDEFLDGLAHDVQKAVSAYTSGNSGAPRSAKVLVPEAVATIENIYQGNATAYGLPTGLVDFDKMTRGLHPGEMIVIAARPSVGKSSMSMNIADHVGVELGQPVGVFSLEMTAESLMLRMICSRARVNIRNVTDGFLKDTDFPKITAAAGKLIKAPIYIDDGRGMSVLQLKAKARQMKQQYGVKLLIVDYLQLLHSTSHRAKNREQEVADVSSGLHALAGELGIPVIVLCQLNRESERRGPGQRPRLSELRESGAIEQDADVVAMLYRTGKEEEESWKSQKEAVPINLLVAKQRNGPTGEIPLIFLRPYTRFEGAAKEKGQDPTENYPAGNSAGD